MVKDVPHLNHVIMRATCSDTTTANRIQMTSTRFNIRMTQSCSSMQTSSSFSFSLAAIYATSAKRRNSNWRCASAKAIVTFIAFGVVCSSFLDDVEEDKTLVVSTSVCDSSSTLGTCTFVDSDDSNSY